MEESKSISPAAAKTADKAKERMTTKGIDFIITFAVASVFLLCPLFFSGLAAQGLGFEKMALFYFLVLLGVVAWVIRGFITGELNLMRTPLDWPIVVTIALFAASTVMSISAKDSLIGSYGSSAKSLIALIIFALFYYLIVNNLTMARIKIFFACLLASTALLAFYSLLQLRGVFLLPLDSAKSISFNPLGSLSGLTMYLVIALPLLVVAVAQWREIFTRSNIIVAWAARVILGAAILASLAILTLLNGFTFWPVAIVGIVIVLMFFMAKIIKISNNTLLIPLAVFLALIVLLVIGNFNIMNQNLPAEVSLSRQASWAIAKASLQENPIFGTGPSTYYYSFAKFKSPDFNATALWNVRFDSASGALFELLATTGILGAVAVVVLGLVALSLVFLTLIKTEAKQTNSILLGLFAAFVCAGLYALLFAQNNSLILMTMIITIFTVAAALVMYPERFKTLKLSFRASAKYALALAAIILCVSAGVVVLFTMGLKMYLADTFASRAAAAGTPEEKILLFNRAVELAPYQDNYYLNLANNYMAQANSEALSSGDQTSIQNSLSLAIDRGRKAVDLAPNKANNNEALALIYENASFYTRGALEWSEDFYNKVTSLDPQNPTPQLRIALINMARSNAETDESEKSYYINEAIKKYDEAIAKKSDLAAAYYGKAIAYERLNDLTNAIENLKKANLASRNNIDYLFELGRLFFNRGVTQPNLSQTASQAIAEKDIAPEPPAGEGATTTGEELSVEPSAPTGAVAGKNDDLITAQQIFLSILQANPNHANARYSLAVLYQKTGEDENARVMAQSLLDVLQDEQTKGVVRQQFADVLE
jgi:tetratricopeptide (TPR) repeat protein